MMDSSNQVLEEDQEQEQQESKARFYSIYYYTFLFDVDTKDVGLRIARSFIPYPATFLSIIQSNPDLYGPFWVASTLIFVLAVTGNIVNYLATSEYSEQWSYENVATLSKAAGIIYGYLGIVPLLLFGVLRYYKVEIKWAQIICIYGYSISVYVPIAVLCLILSTFKYRWLFVVAGALVSTSFLLTNFFTVLKEGHLKKGLIILAAIGILNFAFSLGVILIVI